MRGLIANGQILQQIGRLGKRPEYKKKMSIPMIRVEDVEEDNGLSTRRAVRMRLIEQYLGKRSIVTPSDMADTTFKANLLVDLKQKKANGCAWLFWYLSFIFRYTGLKHITLLLLLVAYSCLGGLIFEYLEHDSEQAHLAVMNKALQMTVDRFDERLSKQENLSRLLTDFYREVARVQGSVSLLDQPLNSTGWTFATATFYSMTLFTTIGYGTIACETDWGQTATVFYSIIGIPLMLVVLSDTGRILYKTLQSAYNRLRYERHKRKKDVQPYEETSLPLSLAIGLFFSYCLLCSLVIYFFDYIKGDMEGMSFGQAFYFCYISLTTIGLGDIMPNNIHLSPYVAVMFLCGLILISVMNSASYGQLETNYLRAMTALEDVLHQAQLDNRNKSRQLKRLHHCKTVPSLLSEKNDNKLTMRTELANVARLAAITMPDLDTVPIEEKERRWSSWNDLTEDLRRRCEMLAVPHNPEALSRKRRSLY